MISTFAGAQPKASLFGKTLPTMGSEIGTMRPLSRTAAATGPWPLSGAGIRVADMVY